MIETARGRVNLEPCGRSSRAGNTAREDAIATLAIHIAAELEEPTGLRNHLDGRWIGGSELLECVQRFMVFHLGHELGTVDNDAIIHALEPFEIDLEPFRWVQDAEELDADWEIPDVEKSFDWPAARELSARLRRMAEES